MLRKSHLSRESEAASLLRAGLGSAMLEEATETQSARRPASAAVQGADYAGAYSGSGQPVAVHQHWLSLCAIVGVRTLLCPTSCGQSI